MELTSAGSPPIVSSTENLRERIMWRMAIRTTRRTPGPFLLPQGEWLLERRLDHQMTQRALAAEIGLFANSLSGYEAGAHPWPLPHFVHAAQQLGAAVLLVDSRMLRDVVGPAAFPPPRAPARKRL